MEYDDLLPKKSSAVALGESLATLSVKELEDRIRALEAEIVRVGDELERKRTHEAAAQALFKK